MLSVIYATTINMPSPPPQKEQKNRYKSGNFAAEKRIESLRIHGKSAKSIVLRPAAPLSGGAPPTSSLEETESTVYRDKAGSSDDIARERRRRGVSLCFISIVVSS